MQGTTDQCLIFLYITLGPMHLLTHPILFVSFPSGIQMLTILVPILVSYLLPAAQLQPTPANNKLRIALHEHSLQWLMKIGPRYPHEFKALMSEAPQLRIQLESAVRVSQQLGSQKGRHDAQNSVKANAAAAAAASSAPVKPIIQLKMDFSNFTASSSSSSSSGKPTSP